MRDLTSTKGQEAKLQATLMTQSAQTKVYDGVVCWHSHKGAKTHSYRFRM